MPSQKFGVEMPHSANTLAALSHARAAADRRRRCRPGCRSTSAIAIAIAASSIVTGSFCSTSSSTGCCVRIDSPRSPLQHAADPVGVAHRQRLVQVQLGVQVGDHGRVLLLAGEDLRRVAGQQLLQPEDQHRHEDQRRHDLRQALGQVLEHRRALASGRLMAPSSGRPRAAGRRARRARRSAWRCRPTASCGGTGRSIGRSFSTRAAICS